MTDKHTLVERIARAVSIADHKRCPDGLANGYPEDLSDWDIHIALGLLPIIETEAATRITALEAREAELVERLSNAAEELEYFVEFARRQSEFEGDAEAGFAVVREARATLAKHHEGE